MAKQIVVCRDTDGGKFDVDVTDLNWRPGAYALVFDKGKILLVKERGRYTLPGGGIELGELPETAVRREVKEETGLDVSDPKLVACRSEFFTHHTKEQDIHRQTILIFYYCTLIGGTISLDWLPKADRPYHEFAEWVDLNKIDDLELLSIFDWRPLARQTAKQSEGVNAHNWH